MVFVNLAPIRDPGLFEHTLIQIFGVRRFQARPSLERLSRHLADRHILLLLDNFEQLMAASLSVAALIESCPRLHILVTSREALHLGGEREFPVHPLALPDPEGISNPAVLARAPAVALFVARAQAIQPEFALTRDNGRIVGEICRRLDGLPLAIELAAARVKVLPPQAMLTRLSQRLPFLVGGTRDLTERHHALRAAVAWSEDLLEPEERTVFQRLAVFAGGSTLEAAQAVAAVDLSGDALTIITSLVNKSLIRQEPSKTAEPRFGMLETIREYAWEQLAAAGEPDRVRDRHLDYFLGLAERAKGLFNTPQAPEAFATMEEEYENMRAALRWASERTNTDAELRMASAVCRFWYMRGNVGETHKWVDGALAKTHEASTVIRAELLHGAATLTEALMAPSNPDDAERAMALDKEGLALARNAGDHETMARTLRRIGAAHIKDDPQTARALLTEGLEHARAVDSRTHVGYIVGALAVLASTDGDKTETILNTIRLWKEYPEKATVKPVVTARTDGSQAVIEAGTFSWRTDLPGSLGGSNGAPSPTLLFLGGLAGCAVVFIRDTLGPLLNVPITDVRALTRCRTDFRGLLGLDGAAPDLEEVELGIEIISPDRRGAQSVAQAWLERCPVYLALTQPIRVATAIEIKTPNRTRTARS